MNLCLTTEIWENVVPNDSEFTIRASIEHFHYKQGSPAGDAAVKSLSAALQPAAEKLQIDCRF